MAVEGRRIKFETRPNDSSTNSESDSQTNRQAVRHFSKTDIHCSKADVKAMEIYV